MNHINHSGGCPGADMYWEIEGRKYGVKSIAYSYKGHKQEGEYPYIMNIDELLEGWKNVQKAAETLKRPLKHIEFNPYVRNLLCRNWFQVKHSEAIFAISTFSTTKLTLVDGGTGWAVQMGIDNDKIVYVYDQLRERWFMYLKEYKKFVVCFEIPTLPENFAGIGARNLNSAGKKAIREIYEHNFKK